ncbi:hypothetical protein TMatcc_006775, partial [Talaromyces marneffei ATCC 18224]
MPVTENMEARVTARCYTVEGLQHAIMGGITGIEHVYRHQHCFHCVESSQR